MNFINIANFGITRDYISIFINITCIIIIDVIITVITNTIIINIIIIDLERILFTYKIGHSQVLGKNHI